jgi:hypothetical protein
LSANSGRAIRRNAAMLPGYSLMLGLLARRSSMDETVAADYHP